MTTHAKRISRSKTVENVDAVAVFLSPKEPPPPLPLPVYVAASKASAEKSTSPPSNALHCGEAVPDKN
jgi:hypothetical protein